MSETEAMPCGVQGRSDLHSTLRCGGDLLDCLADISRVQQQQKDSVGEDDLQKLREHRANCTKAYEESLAALRASYAKSREAGTGAGPSTRGRAGSGMGEMELKERYTALKLDLEGKNGLLVLLMTRLRGLLLLLQLLPS
mmetsp:Transcript_16631/g.46963  ORF Transcript_16631/g.46963 Transcript_16631/m.46963 type:complete len:140 (+) Transcript_16631:97-516(+)|eukprot:CAMPEP_0119141412 /NCGR_PEP_ID=MMETSP1310-20130426/30995_1 /TAXON_ID=464262 /ORGANISM="Genus nov. species nov., Strain RCC2339" /LENGTH=139 /DNA_ID=CAMNT_0007132863 /DNA_START=87 /DNA_END=506 /DNA_ORIENTATION=-